VKFCSTLRHFLLVISGGLIRAPDLGISSRLLNRCPAAAGQQSTLFLYLTRGSSTEVEQLTTDPDIEGSNQPATQQQEKVSEKEEKSFVYPYK
jgi:hypothetical protein